MRVKEENEKAVLNLSIKKTKKLKKLKKHGIWFHHFMANRRGKVETMTDFIFLASKISVDDDCSHEIKKHLLLGRKAMQTWSVC